MGGARRDVPAHLLPAVRKLVFEVVTAEVFAAFETAGVDAILLKGASFAAWLYPGEERRQGDLDVLVAPRSYDRAVEVLRARGFNRLRLEIVGDTESAHQVWVRTTDAVVVEVHHRINGIRLQPAAAWDVLWRHTVPFETGRRTVPVLDERARALHAALHVADHGRGVARPLEDLERALRVAPHEVWAAAADLASELDAEVSFAAGLSLVPQGQALLGELDVAAKADAAALLKAEGPPPFAPGLLVLLRPGIPWRRRAAFLLRKAVPPPDFMRVTSPLARRGRVGLAAAYLARPVVVLAQMPRAIGAVREASRRARPRP